jgi:hypothetical protein
MPTVESKIVDIDAVILFENKAGTAIKIDDGKISCWVPKSLVEDYEDGTIGMPHWLALEKGLI